LSSHRGLDSSLSLFLDPLFSFFGCLLLLFGSYPLNLYFDLSVLLLPSSVCCRFVCGFAGVLRGPIGILRGLRLFLRRGKLGSDFVVGATL
jgi:hypothetical protein